MQDIKKEVDVFILKPQTQFLKESNYSFKEQLFGKNIVEWVLNAVDGFDVNFIDVYPTDNIFSRVKRFLTNKKYSIILYADTPLINYSIIKGIIEYGINKESKILKFNRGYFFENEYIKQDSENKNADNLELETNAFDVVFDNISLSEVSKKLKEKIISYHMKRGVTFIN